jgi:2-polyprenyl-6-methoxyphenol hydroxylase-like FAD-dependent oxidoreductase
MNGCTRAEETSMIRSAFHVLIIGGGIGGLCLAQGLKKAGVSVAVYERDRNLDARLQGYRLNIEPIGGRALHACLPADLWKLLIATAGDPGPRMGVFDEQLRELMQEDEPGDVADAKNAHHAVSRTTLRRLLLAGLDEAVHFDKQFLRYEQTENGQVKAFFADATSATGSVLVGADGARSRVRRQLLPNAREIDTPAVGIGGKPFIRDAAAAWLPPHFATAKNMILPPRDFLFTAAFRRRRSAADVVREAGADLRAAGLQPEELLNETEDRDYLLWAFVGHRRTFPADVSRLGHEELCGLIKGRMRDWHPLLRRIVAESEAGSVEAFAFSASARVAPWSTLNVTLLGDGLHLMPPVGGMGGNAALHDAELLCRALISVRDGAELAPALRACEAKMIRHGFAAVRASLLYTRLAISRIRPARAVAKTFFRLCGALPPLRRVVFSTRRLTVKPRRSVLTLGVADLEKSSRSIVAHVEGALVPGTSHNVMADNPEAVAELVERYAGH